MRKFKVRVSTNKVGSEDWDIIEVPDDTTEEEIEAIAWDALWNMVDWSYEEIIS